VDEIMRWVTEQKAVLSAYPEIEKKRKVKQLDSKFIPLYLRTHPKIELNEREFQFLLENEEFNLLRAEKLEITERIALALEADETKRMATYEAVADFIVMLRYFFSGGLKKQLGTKTPRPFEVVWAIAQNLEWAADMLRGTVSEPPGRFNVDLANLTNNILEHQTKTLTQMELYDALAAAGATLPENPEAFRLWLHRARKQGLVKRAWQNT